MLLAIDTSTRYAGVALADGGRVLEGRCWLSTSNHTGELMPVVADLLLSRDLAVADLDGIAVALGPGGFSALRVGVSVAKGLALAARIPLVGVDTLRLEAFPYRQTGLAVCALLEAGRGEVASLCFDRDGVTCRAELICSPQGLLDGIRETTLFCGEGVATWEAFIKEQLPRLAVVISPYTPAQRLWSLAELGQARLAAGESSDVVELQPNYLRMPSIGAPKRRDWTPQQS